MSSEVGLSVSNNRSGVPPPVNDFTGSKVSIVKGPTTPVKPAALLQITSRRFKGIVVKPSNEEIEASVVLAYR